MANASKKLEDRLQELGNGLASPPSSVEELLPLLDLTDNMLSRVEQSPSQSMLTALQSVMDALVAKELLRHPDVDVKVAVASCVSEITRITAPDAPYDDDIMKEIFRMIVDTFERLDDISSLSFSKRVSILETVAKVRSCVVMLDLECDALILEMFNHFLKTIRLNHPENVVSSMETIMMLVIEESEEISSELLSCLLGSMKKDDKDVLPVARKLVEKVMANCAVKIKPYLMDVIQSMGAPLSDYSEIVASICQGNSDALDHNEINASGEFLADDSKLSERTVSDELPQGSAKLEQEVGCPEKVGTAADNSPTVVMSNGTAQGNGASLVEPPSPKQKVERSRRSGQSKNTVAVNRAGTGNLELVGVKADNMSDLNTKKGRGRKTSVQLTDAADKSQIDSDKEAPTLTSRRNGRTKESDSSRVDPSSGKEAELAVCLEPETKNEPQLSSPTHSERLMDSVRPKRGRPPGPKVATKRSGDNGLTDQPASPSGQKEYLGSGHDQEEALPCKDVGMKESEGISDSEGKSSRHFGRKLHADKADVGEAPATVTSDSEAKPKPRSGKKGSKRKDTEGESSKRKQKTNIKKQKGQVIPEKDVAREPSLKEMISLPKSAMKTPGKDQGHLEDGVRPKSRRKRAGGKEEISETLYQGKELDESIVGSKIKVWWPDDKRFYDGVVHSFIPDSKKHKIIYSDGDEEYLMLKEERWEFVECDTKTDGGQEKDIASTDSLKMLRNKKATPKSLSKQADKEQTASKSDIESRGKDEGHAMKRKGRPKAGASNTGKLPGDDDPNTSRKLRGKALSKGKEETPKSSSKIKDEGGSNSKEVTPMTGSKLKETSEPGGKNKGGTSRSSSKSKDDVLKSSRNSKDDSPKTSSKPKNETPKISSKSKDDTNKSKEITPKTAGKSRDDMPKTKSATGTPRSGRKPRGSITPRRTGGESSADGTSNKKGKSKVEESENAAEAQKTTATTGKKRKRKSRN